MKKEICTSGIALTALVVASLVASSVQAQTPPVKKASSSSGVPATLTLTEYLAYVKDKNKSVKALEASTEAASYRYQATNLELSPVLTLKGSYLDDKGLQTMGPGIFINQNEVRDYSLGISKKFSSGTAASITTGVQGVNTTASIAGTSGSSQTNTGYLAFGLSQSLWKDFFGHGTRLRLDREEVQQKSEKSAYDLQAQQTLIEAENAFWNVLFLEEGIAIRKDSLERAKKIEAWVRRRVSNGIGDRADLLNAQGLTAARELELLNMQDNYVSAQKILAETLELGPDEKIPKLRADLDQARPMTNYVSGKGAKIVRMDSYIAALEAQSKELSARETIDSMRPDLVLEGAYRTNGYDTDMRGAYVNSTDSDNPTASIGVKLVWLMDWGTTGSIKTAARQDALAAKYNKERKMIESETSWSEFQRRHDELTKKIEASRKMAQIQQAKAAAQRDKLSKGRAITSDVIIAEQDAAEAQLTVTQLRADQRKLEAQGRIFVKVEDSL